MSSASNRIVNTCSYSDNGNRDGNAEIRQMRSAPKQRTVDFVSAKHRSSTEIG